MDTFSMLGLNINGLKSDGWKILKDIHWCIVPSLVGMTILGFLFSWQLRNSKNPIDVWRRLNFLPFVLKKKIFTRILWHKNPFSKRGNIDVDFLEVGKCICKVKETNALHNPFRSIHAAELILLGETSAGLALFTRLTSQQRAIVTEIQTKFFKKARGIIVSVSKLNSIHEGKIHVISELREGFECGTLVATVVVIFLVDSKETKKIT
ncbi:hypothetical protein HMI54_011269 [Coelomomyces lativittatus]|nr:hypothetical protein HMI56_004523 [Coelomomyces lativittatus]KAJ1515931.1 hypothetical protein HMI55_003219 [Coelomomyces lativittatus]KAJ1515963.1 hypothetical protein HMI54_011269 [Coelomomyces lativittatus]